MTYSPTNNLLDAIRILTPLEVCPWDDYFPRMAQTDWLSGRHNLRGSKTYFIRKAPFKGSYAVMGGLTAFIRTLHDFRYDSTVCEALLDMGYRKDFVEYLQGVKKRVDIDVYAIPEGGLFFPDEPAIVLEGSLLDRRIAEGMLLKNVNFPSLAFTKWSRVVQAATPGAVMEFSRRRAQDDLRSTIYAHLAGAAVSSNAQVRCGLNVKITGTMGHEYIQGYGNQFEAFDSWLEYNPDRPVLLGDTEDTIRSGLPDAIRAFKKHWEKIMNAKGNPGFRLDSGDLAYLTIECRKGFDSNELESVSIFETNDLDEYSIEGIREQIYTHAPKAGLDPYNTIKKIVWACGTQPGTCADQPSIGGVAKLTSNEVDGIEYDVIKLAKDNSIKTSIPGNNRSALIVDSNTGFIECCLIYQKNQDPSKCKTALHKDDDSKKMALGYENQRVVPRQVPVYFDHNTHLMTDTNAIIAYHQQELDRLHWTHKRLEASHAVKVSLSPELFNVRREMIRAGILINK